MILLDTSAWVEFLRGTGSAVHLAVYELIETEQAIAVTEPVLAEVLAGARTDLDELRLRRLLGRFTLLPFDAGADFDGAVRVYRRCRASGVTPRGLIDCMIATVAIRHGATLLARDADISRIADVMNLELHEATPRDI